MEATSSRATTQFMRQLKRMFEEVDDIIWDQGAIIIPDPAKLEKILPRYYKTSKFSSFQRQLNNFGYHRSYATNERIDRSKSRGVCYHKVAGAPPSADIEGLLALRPLVRRKKRDAMALSDSSDSSTSADEPPRRRPALGSLSSVSGGNTAPAGNDLGGDHNAETRSSSSSRAAAEKKSNNYGVPREMKTGRALVGDLATTPTVLAGPSRTPAGVGGQTTTHEDLRAEALLSLADADAARCLLAMTDTTAAVLLCGADGLRGPGGDHHHNPRQWI